MVEHWCHANGCQAEDAHQENPFCRRHFKMLPRPLQKDLWAERRQDGTCGACLPGDASEVRLSASRRWPELFNLGVAICLLVEFEDGCGAPESMHDEDSGFCWGCGVDDAQKTYGRAARAVEKFALMT